MPHEHQSRATCDRVYRPGALLHELNEDTLWSGEPYDTNNDEAAQHLEELRKLVFARQYVEAEEVARQMQGPRNQAYEPLGNLRLMFQHSATAEMYRRELDLRNACAEVRYTSDGATFTRTVFSSAVDNVLVVRLESDQPGTLSFTAALDSELHASNVIRAENRIALHGRCPRHVPVPDGASIRPIEYGDRPDGKNMRFEAQLHVMLDGGQSATNVDGSLSISYADAATLLLAAVTSYHGFDQSPSENIPDLAGICSARLDDALKKGYAQLRSAHISDYQPLFQRVELDLGDDPHAEQPTDERLEAVRKEASDEQLIALSFQYGRYLLIASSRPGTQPANLQGIWNKDVWPAWYTMGDAHDILVGDLWVLAGQSNEECIPRRGCSARRRRDGTGSQVAVRAHNTR